MKKRSILSNISRGIKLVKSNNFIKRRGGKKMKKIVMLICAFCAVFSLSACGQKEETKIKEGDTQIEESVGIGDQSSSEDKTENSDEVSDFDIFSDLGSEDANNIVWGKQDEETKNAFVLQGKENGYDISFGSDGSTTLINDEFGEKIVQNPDGTWVIKSNDGTVGQYGGEWPDNKFTRLIPKPNMELMAASTDGQTCSVALKNATLEQIKDYVEKVKAAGFSVDAEVTDQEIDGSVIYYYTAKNSDGYTITVSSANGISGILIGK